MIAVSPTTTVEQAARAMRAHDIACLVVGEPGEWIAIVTERDLTTAIADGLSMRTSLKTVASPDPLALSLDATVMDAATLMLGAAVRHLVVTNNQRAVGVVSIRDVLAVLVEAVTPETVFLLVRRLSVDAA